jgi:hypothetical protein
MKDRLRTNLHSLISSRNRNAAVSVTMRKMRANGASLMAIRDVMRARGFPISHQLVANTIARHAAGGTACASATSTPGWRVLE